MVTSWYFANYLFLILSKPGKSHVNGTYLPWLRICCVDICCWVTAPNLAKILEPTVANILDLSSANKWCYRCKVRWVNKSSWKENIDKIIRERKHILNKLVYLSLSHFFHIEEEHKNIFISIEILKKSRIRETKHLSTDADSSTDTKKILLVRQNSPKNKLFVRGDFTPFINKSF